MSKQLIQIHCRDCKYFSDKVFEDAMGKPWVILACDFWDCQTEPWGFCHNAKSVSGEKPKSPAEEIRAIRQSLGLTQQEFAEMIGKNRVTVSRYEQGHFLPSKKTASKIRALGGEYE